MSTEKQITANRLNALKSTGPKTPIGKKLASRNAIRHGFYTSDVVLPTEDLAAYQNLARSLIAAYDPCGALEEAEVCTIIETCWQLKRANVVDTELFRIYGFLEHEQRGVGTAFAQDATQGNAFTKLTRYQGFLFRKLRSAQKELQQLRSKRIHGSAIPCHSVPNKACAIESNPSEIPQTPIKSTLVENLPVPNLDDQPADSVFQPVVAQS
jgi:hypothetical protein